jgi:SOS response regulatory protein OraA/RecX
MTRLELHKEAFTSYANYKPSIRKKIQDYVSKNKSKKYITQMLTQKYPNFKQEISELIREIVPDEEEIVYIEYEKILKKYDISEYKTRQKNIQKIIQKLYFKGFSYDIIKKVMHDK